MAAQLQYRVENCYATYLRRQLLLFLLVSFGTIYVDPISVCSHAPPCAFFRPCFLALAAKVPGRSLTRPPTNNLRDDSRLCGQLNVSEFALYPMKRIAS